MIFDKYPYTNFHELNDDWIIKVLKEMSLKLDEFVAANSLTYADPIAYNPETIYPANTVVIDDNTAYVSKCPVPAGILPTNGDYWLLIFPFGDLIETGINESETALTARIDDYLATAVDSIPGMVNSWMSSHPEYTTTVADGAISWRKFSSATRDVFLQGYSEDASITQIASSEYEQGTINMLNGSDMASNQECRTGMLHFKTGIVLIRAAVDLLVTVFQYAPDGTFELPRIVGVNENWNAIKSDSARSYRLTVMKQDQTSLSPSELPLVPAFYANYTPNYATTSDFAEISEHIEPKNKFNKNDYQVINANINTSTNKLVSNTALRTVYLRIDPNTTYTVSKMRSARFIIAFTDEETVENNIDCTGVVYNNNATQLTSTSGANSKWMLILCYSTSADTATLTEILNTLQVEIGDTATAYENWFEPFYIANDAKARQDLDDLAQNTVNAVNDLTQLSEDIRKINFSDLFSLADTYIDDFYGRTDFIDANHEYTQYGTLSPTLDTTGAYTYEGSGVSIFTRSIPSFPFFFTIGTLPGAYMQICFKVKSAAAGQFVRLRFDPNTGVLLHESSALGYLDCATNWLFFEVMPDSVTVYDDSGNMLVAPITFTNADPQNYGVYFGQTYRYGISAITEWAVKDLNSLDVIRAVGTKNMPGLSHYMSTLIYSRSYMSGGQRYTVSDPGDQYIKVLEASDNDNTIEYTNNPILRCQMDWTEDGTYRSEIGITGTLSYEGVMQRHEASIDYFIPAADNPESSNPNEQFDTYILQIHDLYYSAPGWLDPPPVYVSYKGGKLYATVCYIENGEVPDSASVIRQDRYYLCDVPDDWFTLGLKLRTAYKPGFGPLLTITINGVDKLTVYTPIGFNIYRDGGLTRLTFGLYAPNWAYQTYATAHRKLYIANVKYNY